MKSGSAMKPTEPTASGLLPPWSEIAQSRNCRSDDQAKSA